MRTTIVLFLTICALLAEAAHAATIADLATDYRSAQFGQTTDDVGLAGTLAGSWHYYQDTDSNPANGTGPLLVYRHFDSLNNGGNEYSGTQQQFMGWLMPMVSGDSLFDNPNVHPPAGSIMGHPGNNQLVAIQYLSTTAISNLSIAYYFEKPNTFGQANVTIRKGDGTVLLGTSTIGCCGPVSISGTLSGLGTLGAGESVWLMLGSGGGFEGDQTWMKMTINGDAAIPEPAAWILCLPVLAGIVRRSFRKR